MKNNQEIGDDIMDAWENRRDRMKCESCIWFVLKKVKAIVNDNNLVHHVDMLERLNATKAFCTKNSHNLGRCRRHAPAMNGYPVVFINDWCGDHKLSEDYIQRTTIKTEKGD